MLFREKFGDAEHTAVSLSSVSGMHTNVLSRTNTHYTGHRHKFVSTWHTDAMPRTSALHNPVKRLPTYILCFWINARIIPKRGHSKGLRS